MTRSWALLTIDGLTQYGGNAGYDDEVTTTYRYDSSVANCRNLGVGDFVVLRDRKYALGAAVVESISTSSGIKERLRCPGCHKTGIKRRTTISPEWRCMYCGDEFDRPVAEEVNVTLFEAEYETTYIPLGTGIAARSIKAAALRPNDQLSIEEINPGLIDWGAAKNGDRVIKLLRLCAHMEYGVPESDVPRPEAEPDSNQEENWNGSDDRETRRRVLREIAARRGQAIFRKNLIARFGGRCAITGCEVSEALEAAHVSPYRTERDNRTSNGILLRSDIHTLFDLDLIGIEPGNRTVALHPDLLGSEYGALQGRSGGPGTDRVSHASLKERWRAFDIRSRKRSADR